MSKVIKEVIKTSVATITTVFLTVLLLGLMSGSNGKNYTVYDVPGFGKAMRGTRAFGETVGEKMRSSAQPTV